VCCIKLSEAINLYALQVPVLLQDPGPVLQLHRVQQEEAGLWQGALIFTAVCVSGCLVGWALFVWFKGTLPMCVAEPIV
jgi:hypothetical protein